MSVFDHTGSHKFSVIVKRLALNNHRTDVMPLPDKEAVELGADIIGEVFVYSIAAVILTREYIDSSTKTSAKESKLNAKLEELEQSIDALNNKHTAERDALHARVALLEEELAGLKLAGASKGKGK